MKAYELNSNRELRSNLRIDTAIVPALDTGNIVIDQNDLLQNLAGHDSIIGRAVVVVRETAWDGTSAP